MKTPRALGNQFNKDYIRLIYSRQTHESVVEQVSFVIAKLQLRKGMKILDIGSGNGRHAIEFAKRGYQVTAVDSSPALSVFAQTRARSEDVMIRFLRQDMHKILFREEFDAVINMFSFGFLRNREDHEILFEKISRSLKKGGKFFLITSNGEARLSKIARTALQDKKTRLFTQISKEKLSDGVFVTTNFVFDLSKRQETIISRWKEGGSIHSVTTSSYLFLRCEILFLLYKANLIPQKLWGDFQEAPLSETSSVLMIYAKKK